MDIETMHPVQPAATREALREHFKESEVLCINLVGSPNAGKTCLIEKTLSATQSPDKVATLLGNATSDDDVKRLQRFGGYVKRAKSAFNANAVFEIVSDINLDQFEILFIENTSDPVSAAEIDLGEHTKVAVMSVAEGENKAMLAKPEFAEAELCIVNKIDLLPNLKFNVAIASKNIAAVHHGIQVLELSCRTGEGLDQWLRWLECRKEREFPTATAKL